MAIVTKAIIIRGTMRIVAVGGWRRALMVGFLVIRDDKRPALPALGHAEAGGTGTRVDGHLELARREAGFGDEVEEMARIGPRRGPLGPIDRRGRRLLEEALHHPILQRMEGDDGQ